MPARLNRRYNQRRSRLRAAAAAGWPLRLQQGRRHGPPCCGAAGQGRPSAFLATASWIATEKAPHQRLAQPAAAALFTAGCARRARSGRGCALTAAAPHSVKVCRRFAALGDLLHRPINLDGAGLRVTRACKGGHQGRIAAEGASVGSCIIDHEIEAPAVVRGDVSGGCASERAIVAARHSAPTASRATCTQAQSTILARLASKPVLGHAKAWSPRASTI